MSNLTRRAGRLKAVVIGGGGGIQPPLAALKPLASITAVCTNFDSGGSSGDLSRASGVPPYGDRRRALTALSEAEPDLKALFNYRFSADLPGLGGHSTGNLISLAMNNLAGGNDKEALRRIERLLRVKGHVLPVSWHYADLIAETTTGDFISGEVNIGRDPRPKCRVFLHPPPAAAPEVLKAIRTADLITIGPGSLYTSIIPNLIVKGIAEALDASKAVKIFICNLANQSGETDGYTTADHLRAVTDHMHGLRIMDYAVIHNGPVLHREDVLPDLDMVGHYCPLIAADMRCCADPMCHDPLRLASILLRLWTHGKAQH